MLKSAVAQMSYTTPWDTILQMRGMVPGFRRIDLHAADRINDCFCSIVRLIMTAMVVVMHRRNSLADDAYKA